MLTTEEPPDAPNPLVIEYNKDPTPDLSKQELDPLDPSNPSHIFKIEGSILRTQCAPVEQVMHRDFIIVNEDKVKYCYGIHDTFIDMDLKMFISFLPAVKSSLSKIVKLKGTLYCSMCDAHKQQFFSPGTKEILIAKDFCRRLLDQERDYFMFMHVVYVELLDDLLQYLACFETDARVFSFPFPSFMSKYRRRIKFVKACLTSVGDKKNFFKNCYMICRKFSLTRFSPFYEGDLELFRRVNVALHSFLRKFRRAEKLQSDADMKDLKKFGVKVGTEKTLEHAITVPENVDGEMLEPFGAHLGVTDKQHYLEDHEMQLVYGTVNTEKYSLAVDQHDPKAVKEYKVLKKQREKENMLALKEKVAEETARLDDIQQGKWVPPEKRKFKLPPDTHYVGLSGLIDRLSRRKYKDGLHRGHYAQRGKHKFTRDDWKFEKLKHEYGALINEKFDKEEAREKARKKKEEAERAERLKNELAAEKLKKALAAKEALKKTGGKTKVVVKEESKSEVKKKADKQSVNDNDDSDIVTTGSTKSTTNADRLRVLEGTKTGGKSGESTKSGNTGGKTGSKESDAKKKESDAKKKSETPKVVDAEKKPKSKEETPKKKKKKKATDPYKVNDQLSSKISHKHYRDVISNPNPQVAPGRPKPEKLPEVVHVEPLSAIFDKTEAAVDITCLVHEFEEEGLDPLAEMDHLNYQFDTERLIEIRYKLPERLDRVALNQYLLLSKKRVKEFNEDISEITIKDFDTMDEKMRDIKDMRKKMEVLMKDKVHPAKVMILQSKIAKMEKEMIENEAASMLVEKHARRQQKKRDNMESDLNKNRYKDYHHHKDLYYEDTFAGIHKEFEEMFGS